MVIHQMDNVAVAIKAIKAGEKVFGAIGKEIMANADIPPSHKVAISEIPENGRIIKYGESIGLATVQIKPGDWVHTHNIKGEEN
jgi:altronate dehydratase small subunit